MDLTKADQIKARLESPLGEFLADQRFLISETEDKNMKIIQNVALFVLASNCGIIAYWFRKHKPIFNDFRKNHGAKKVNGGRNGQPRTQSILGCPISGCCIGLNRFIILVDFLLKILVPFIDSITGKSNRYTAVRQRLTNFLIK